MQDVHPPDGFGFAHPAQVTLRRLQVLMPEDDLRDDLQRNPASACVDYRIATQVMWRNVHLEPGV